MKKQQATPNTGKVGWHSLPDELRLKIYHMTWEPRVVCVDRIGSLEKHLLGRPKLKRKWNYQEIKLRVGSMTKPPVSLHLNAEARAETLRHYVPLFQGVDEKGEPQILYFNPTLDVMFLSFFPDPWRHNGFQSGLDPRRNRDAARLRNLVCVARTVYYTGADILFDELCRGFDEDPGRWFAAGEEPIRHWEIDPLERADDLQGHRSCNMSWNQFRERCSLRAHLLRIFARDGLIP